MTAPSNAPSAHRFRAALSPVKRLVAGVLVAASVTTVSAAAFAAPQYEAIVVDARTGKVLIAQNPDAHTYPASLTKMMTLYLLFDALQHGRVSLSTPLVVSQHAAAQAPSRLGIDPGDSLTVDQAIRAIVTKSANDVAVAIGEHLAGDEPSFATKMTATARRLGMRNTEFKNASGLPNLAQHTTARDIATLSLALRRDFPQFYHYFSIREFNWDGDVIPSHNRVMLHYPGADGLKTGYIAAAGFNLATSATHGNVRLVGVIMGGTSGSARDRAMVALLDQGFALAGKQGPVMASADVPPVVKAGHGKKEAPAVVAKPASVPPPPEMVAALDDPSDEGGQWGIQVGAYSTKVKATHEAALAASKITGAGDSGDLSTSVVASRLGKATVYEARVMGLDDARDARRACRTLAGLHIGQPQACIAVPPLTTAAR